MVEAASLVSVRRQEAASDFQDTPDFIRLLEEQRSVGSYTAPLQAHKIHRRKS